MSNSRRVDPSSSSGLVTYIGYITGPRAIQPSGVRVMEPPPNSRQVQRGNFYAVVELFGEHPDRATIAEQLLSELQQTYYAAKGSQSQVIVDAVQRAQTIVRDVNAHSAGYPLQAGLICAALLNGKLVVVSSGPAFALVNAGGRVQMFPADPVVGSGGFGNSPIELFREELQTGDALMLAGGSWLQQVHDRTLAGIVAYTTADNCSAAADELYARAGDTPIPGLLIALAEGQGPPRRGPSAPGPGPSGPGGTPPPRQTPPRRPRFGGLPTALTTSPPARMPPTESEMLAAQAAQHERPLGASHDEQEDAPLATPAVPDEGAATAIDERDDSYQLVDDAHALTADYELASDDAALYRTEVEAPDVPGREAVDEELSNLAEEAPPVSPQDAAAATSVVLAAMEAAAQAEAAKRAAAREAEIAAPLLPQEPGDEVEPLFPSPSDEEEPQPGPRRSGQVAGQLAAGWQATRNFFGRMLPERVQSEPLAREDVADEEDADEEDAIWPAEEVRRSGREPVSAEREPPPRPPQKVLEQSSADESWTPEAPVAPAPKLEAPVIGAPQRTGGPRARLFLSVAILILVLVPTVVAAVLLGQGGSNKEEAEKLTANAELLLLGAQSALDQGDRVLARERLTEARELLARAIELDGTNEVRANLSALILAELQEVLQVMPLYGLTAPILTFPAEARPRKVVVVDEDIFVLDSGRQAIIQYRFDPSTRMAGDQPGQIIIRQGESVDGVVMGTPADIVYLPLTPGIVDRPSLLILDRNNNIFRFDPRVAGVSLVNLANRADWGSVTHLQTFNGLIYLVDEGRSQIWRLNPMQTDTPATAWFVGQSQVNLAGLMSIEIDGDIWLLFSNGMILRYRTGEQLPFSPENSIALADEPSDMVVTWRESANIYLVDAAQERILVYDKSGAYLQQLRAPEEHMLRGLVGLTIDEVSGVMFILTQSGLFAHPLVQ